MSEHTFDDKDMGYFLPEDSQLLLTQIKNHIHFLARLAQPRIADETKEWAPAVGMAELMFCLDQLAEQLDLVLKDVSLLKQPQPAKRSHDTPKAAEAMADEEADQGAGVVEDAYAGEAEDQRFVSGVTLDQIDKLNLLISCIKAYSDAVFADGMADFAEGSLSMLGYTIFDRAVEVDEIVKEIDAQSLKKGVHRLAVEEARPAYMV
ncbi:hypothetical protein [Pseudoxanthomonas sp.]|uniref:XAC0095 family protein n=1 Tax=Pseudoxanthomonas sp. TaxID=1871049 RepID=UPI0026171501|nr:hypothetical protein [Pseudoxanthomonas sp.]WDS37925.1 MAG: hypothetical protein O8I58_08695 [Pseudoxanthomonas sp.]